MINKIIELLTEQKKIYSEILELSKEKQQAIIDSDAQKVNEIVKAEWEKLNIATELEKNRVACVKDLIAKQNLDVDNLTLSQIAKQGNEDQQKKLNGLRDDLVAITKEQKEVNEKSKGILDLHFEYMDFMVNNFLKETQLSNIYGNSGDLADTTSNNKGLIDNQA